MSHSVVTKIARGLSRRAAARVGDRVLPMVHHRPLVSITFDDCPRSAVTDGAAILEACGVRGSFYLCGGLVARSWENGQQFECADARRLIDAGHEVGCHTYNHPDCAGLSAAEIARELDQNRAFFSDMVPGFIPRTFAYPYGSVSMTAKRVIASAFAACRGVEHGINVGHVDLGMLKSVAISQGERDIRWLKPWLMNVVASRGWLVLHTHDVSIEPTPYGCTPTTLTETILAIQNAGVDIVTVSEAADTIRGAALKSA
jgi:peptidoglycan/xylan/chitin deacetylase (PgdA/CDA1 family)